MWQFIYQQPASKKKSPVSSTGFSLIEILFATLVVAMTLTAIATSLSYSIKINNQSNYRSAAIDKAREGLDFFKRERVTLGWNTFHAELTDESGPNYVTETYCLPTIPDPSSLPGYVAFDSMGTGACSDYDLTIEGIAEDFKRDIEVEIDPDTLSNKLTITVTVSWMGDKGTDHTVELSQDFHQW